MPFENKKGQTLIGLDISTNAIAFSLYRSGKLCAWGKLNMHGPRYLRNAQANRYARWMKYHFNPNLVAYESAVYVQNRKTVITLAEVFGAVVSSLVSSDTEVREVTPIQWQSAIGNKPLNKEEKEDLRKAEPGKSKSYYQTKSREIRKERTRQWVKKKFFVDIDDDDVTDAISIGAVIAIGEKVNEE